MRVQVSDGSANSNIFNLPATVSAVNDPPEITGQSSLSINEEAPLTVLLTHLTISDPDNTSGFTFTLGNGPNYSVSGSKS